jgi:hypothetical protein
MEFLYPSFAFALLSLIPLLIIHKLIRQDKLNIFPSNFLWEEVLNEQKASKKLNKLRRSLPLLLQIFMILLVSFILIEPIFLRTNGENIVKAIVMDTSYSMNIADGEETRLDVTKKEILNQLSELKNGEEIMLYAIDSEIKEIEKGKLGSVSFRGKLVDIKGSNSSRSELKTVEELNQLALSKDIDEIWFYSDQKYNGLSDKIRLVTKGQEIFDNVGIENMKIEKNNIVIEVKNYSNNSAKKTIDIVVDGKSQYSLDIELNAEERLFKTFDIDIPFEFGVAKIREKDLYDDDNIYYFTESNMEEIKVLLLGDENDFLDKALSVQKKLKVTRSEENNLIEGYDLYVFSGEIPEKMLEKGAVLIFENNGDDNIDISKGYRLTDNSVFEYIEPSFSLMSAKGFKNTNDVLPLMYSGQNLIAYGKKTESLNVLRFGFDLYDSDLMIKKEFPILMKNSISWLLGEKEIGKKQFVVDEYYDNSIVLKNPGIYDENSMDITRTIAVNLDSQEEKKGLNYKSEAVVGETNATNGEYFENYRYVLLILLFFILILEWGVYRYDR